MQIDSKQFDKEKHEKYPALSVKLPYAHYIAKGMKTIEVRSKPTKFRGTLVICSSQKPEIEGMIAGATLCKVDLVDCIPVKNLSEDEWDDTFIASEKKKHKGHYAWKLENVRPVIELPVKGQLGIWKLILDNEELMEYPKYLPKYIQASNDMNKATKLYVQHKKIAIITSTIVLIVIALLIVFAVM